MASQGNHPGRDLAAILGLLALWLFGFPVSVWWLLGTPAWYLPYLLWLGVILLAVLAQRWRSRRGP